SAADQFAALERWVADDGVEAAGGEDVGEFERPVEEGDAGAELGDLFGDVGRWFGAALEDGEVEVGGGGKGTVVAGGGPEPGGAGDLGGQREQLAAHLLGAPDATDEGIPVLEAVVEEGERLAFGQRDQPERELGHFDGHRVLVDAVEAAVGDDAAGEGEALFG